MLKNDRWIREMAQQGMITPFVPELVRKVEITDSATVLTGGGRSEEVTLAQKTLPVISYGVSSYGYDLRLSGNDFRVFRHIPGAIVDPKQFNPQHLEPVALHEDDLGQYFIIPANSYGLGVALERLEIPNNITVVCVGKSTYARCGIIANISPGEAGWQGYLTLEFSNSSSADCRIYANEGVVQLLFLEGEPCETSYEARQGKYQGQGCEVTLAKV